MSINRKEAEQYLRDFAEVRAIDKIIQYGASVEDVEEVAVSIRGSTERVTIDLSRLNSSYEKIVAAAIAGILEHRSFLINRMKAQGFVAPQPLEPAEIAAIQTALLGSAE